MTALSPSRLLAAAIAALLAGGSAAGLTACSGGSASSATGDHITVMAAFYPLQYAAERVGESQVDVVGLTPPGAEPHDIELSPQQVAQISEADLILYIGGFQPAVDEAVAQVGGDRAVDVSQGVRLLPGPGGQGVDPHIWLDPRNMVTISDAIAARLSDVAPGDAGGFAAAAARLDEDLQDLDGQWASGTEKCSSRDLVVSHEAFGYLADRYRFRQVGISGLSPEAEPSPAKVAEVSRFVQDNKVRTIYFETLVDPKVAQTVADETGATTAVLDPLEGLPPGSDGDYLSVMRANLRTVQDGQPCP